MRWLRGFGRFWYDFLVGDSAVLAVGGVFVLVLGWLAASLAGVALAQVLVPLAVTGVLAFSLLRVS